MDVFKNATNPYIASTQVAMGNAQLVAAEVLISKLLRKILGMSQRSFTYLVAVHAASLPLIGGLSAPFSPPVGYRAGVYATEKFVKGKGKQKGWGGNMAVLKAAAASVPAVWLAEYVVQTSGVGFHVPKPNIRDALMTAAAKMLTKPLIGMSFETILPAAVRNNFEVASALESAYNRASSLRGVGAAHPGEYTRHRGSLGHRTEPDPGTWDPNRPMQGLN